MPNTSKSKPLYPADQNDEVLRGGAKIVSSPLIKVRRSKVHGSGVFAVAPIKKGTRIIEYLGDRVSHKVADDRYEDHDENDNHTFLFIVDKRTVIDAGVGGNAARFINHQCDPNCESVIQNRRVYIEAIRNIEPGEELGYDYQIGREKDDPDDVDEVYACRCGASSCRGTMLWPAKRPVARKRRASSARRSKSSARKTSRQTARKSDKKAGKRAARR
ncbi:MAG TPA: SET domain-containing protein-lysine N-methyltransferase [Steroidobacteraceae bacterium]|nr:SET domain-containing protein-lysine N-methyltransferase [Steroidobacteraceae bacterium]HRX89068.1 SET domain-containing protein-lysine N-methyltransferase [Steroidobacteraceae bacterium]